MLRELEGLSYAEIGRRMGMSRPAVESTLFRARRRLTEEFDDIVSGARCLRIQGIIVTAVEARLGTRDTRRLARHLAHCQGCRREALAAGLDRSLFARPSMRERVATKVAGFLPLPGLLGFRRGADAPPPPSGRGASFASHLPMLSDQLSGGWGKAVAGAAVLAAGVSAGVGVHHVASAPSAPPRTEQSATPPVTRAATTTIALPAPALAGDSAAAATPIGPPASARAPSFAPGGASGLVDRRRAGHVARRRFGAVRRTRPRPAPARAPTSTESAGLKLPVATRTRPRDQEDPRRHRPGDHRRRQRRGPEHHRRGPRGHRRGDGHVDDTVGGSPAAGPWRAPWTKRPTPSTRPCTVTGAVDDAVGDVTGLDGLTGSGG